MEVKLGGRLVDIPEPPFKKLKVILAAYGKLSEHKDADQIGVIYTQLTGNIVPVTKLLEGELVELMRVAPQICHLQVFEPGSRSIFAGKRSDSAVDWDGIYAHLCASLGWTWDYIDNNMTLSRLEAMNEYWAENPPVHQLVAAYLGYKGSSKDSGKKFLENLFSNNGM